MRAATVLSLLALVACNSIPDTVLVTGNVMAAHDSALPLASGEIRLYDGLAVEFDKSDVENGAFELEAPSAEHVFTRVSGPGLERAWFTGDSGIADFAVGPGDFFGFSHEERAEWEALFAGCEGGEGTGLVVGEVRYGDLLATDSDEHLLVADGAVYLHGDNDYEIAACYLDDEGVAWNSDATGTGLTGKFLIAGVPAGTYSLAVGFPYTPAEWVYEFYSVHVDEGDVAPRFPAYVDFF